MKTNSKISLVTFLLLCLNSGLLIPFVYSQPADEIYPILLIHGYASDATVWDKWLMELENSGITTQAVTFSDNPATSTDEDKCGRSVNHAIQLNQIVEQFKKQTGAEKINIVTHSKGGLDARVYLANNPSNDDVANLIMIGTPNDGSPIADRNHEIDRCKPAVYDLMTTSPVNNVANNENTDYYTIAGNWISEYYWQYRPLLGGWVYEDINCPYPLTYFDFDGWRFLSNQISWRSQITGENDGIVPVDSVEEPGKFIPYARTDNCHTNLFSNEEYNHVLSILG